MDGWKDGQIIHVFSFFKVKKYYGSDVKSMCSFPFDAESWGHKWDYAYEIWYAY